MPGGFLAAAYREFVAERDRSRGGHQRRHGRKAHGPSRPIAGRSAEYARRVPRTGPIRTGMELSAWRGFSGMNSSERREQVEAATAAWSVSGVPHDRYPRAAIVLHWAIAVFIIFNLCSGFLMEGLPWPVRFIALVLHVSSGLTVLALTVARVIWRLLNDPPPYPAGMKPWERHTAHFAHFLLYAAMVLMPLSGWAMLSAHPPPGSRGAAVQFAIPPAAPPGLTPEVAGP